MEINQDNPFVTGFVFQYLEGDFSLERAKLKYIPSENDKLHQVTEWDNLSDLSFDNYGSSKWWWVIADINNVFDPFNLSSHINLIIPDLTPIKADL